MVSLLINTPITAALSKLASTALITHTLLAGAVIGMRLPNPIVVRLTKAKQFDCAKFKLHPLPLTRPLTTRPYCSTDTWSQVVL